MALVFSLSPSLFFSSSRNAKPLLFLSSKTKTHSSLCFFTPNKTHLILRRHSSSQPDPVPGPDSQAIENPVTIADECGEKTEPETEQELVETQVTITDEWGEKTEPEEEQEPTKFADSDPPKDEDEWEEFVGPGNGRAAALAVEDDDKVGNLTRCLVDTVYGTDLGFRAGADIRAEVLELVNQLEALNPTPSPVDVAGVLDGH